MTIATLKLVTFAELADEYTLTVEDTSSRALDSDATDPILVGDDGDLLDGFHRVRGYLLALEASPDLADDEVRAVVVHSADVAAIIAEPGNGQDEAIALAYALAL